jgi:hypothetical protein
LYEEIDPFMKPDFTLLGELPGPVRCEKVPALHHVHFTTLGFGAAVWPELAMLTHADARLADGVLRVTRRTAEFLNGHLVPHNSAAERAARAISR